MEVLHYKSLIQLNHPQEALARLIIQGICISFFWSKWKFIAKGTIQPGHQNGPQQGLEEDCAGDWQDKEPKSKNQGTTEGSNWSSTSAQQCWQSTHLKELNQGSTSR